MIQSFIVEKNLSYNSKNKSINSKIEQIIEQNIKNVSNRLHQNGDALTKNITNSLNNFEKSSSTISACLNKTANEILESFENQFNQLDFDGKFQNLNQTIVVRGTHSLLQFQEQIDKLENRANDLPSIFHKVSATTVTELNQHIGKLEQQVKNISDRLHQNGHALTNIITNRLTHFEESSWNINTRLNKTANELMQSFEDQFHQLDFDSKFQNLNQTIVNRGKDSLLQFQEQIDKIENRANDLPSVFDNIAARTVTELNQHMGIIEQQVKHVSDRLHQNGKTLTNIITNRLNHFEESSSNISTRLNKTANEVLESFEKKFNQLDFDDKFHQLNDTILHRGEESLLQFQEQIDQLENRANNNESSDRLSQNGNILAETISTHLNRSAHIVLESFDGRFQKLNNTIIDYGNQSLLQFQHQIDKLENQANNLPSVFDNIAARTINELNKYLGTIEQQINQSSDRLSKNSYNISTHLNNTAKEVLESFDDSFQRLNNTIIDHGTQSFLKFQEQINQIENKAKDLPSVFDNVTTKTVTKLDQQIENIEQQIHYLSNRFDQNGDILTNNITNSLNTFEQSSSKISTSLNTTANSIS
jgi:uncharacterized protein YicC (UPF0701 family)